MTEAKFSDYIDPIWAKDEYCRIRPVVDRGLTAVFRELVVLLLNYGWSKKQIHELVTRAQKVEQ